MAVNRLSTAVRWARTVLTFYFIGFATVYAARLDISPSTEYLWRFALAAVSFACAVMSVLGRDRAWTILGFGILILSIAEIAITVYATQVTAENLGREDFGYFYAWRTNPRPFFVAGFKVHMGWFLVHALAGAAWFLGSPYSRRFEKYWVQYKPQTSDRPTEDQVSKKKAG